MKRTSGFTLIEIVVVIAILGIIAGMALPDFQRFLIKRDLENARTQMMQTLQLARQIARAENTLVNVTLRSNRLIITQDNSPQTNTISFSKRIQFEKRDDNANTFDLVFRPTGSIAIRNDDLVTDASSDIVINLTSSNSTDDALSQSVTIGVLGSVASS